MVVTGKVPEQVLAIGDKVAVTEIFPELGLLGIPVTVKDGGVVTVTNAGGVIVQLATDPPPVIPLAVA